MNLQIPQYTKRVVLVSNVSQPPPFTFEQGDLIVEMNRAVHHTTLLNVLENAPVNKFLFIRHNKDGHFFPENFCEKSNTWDCVVMSSERFGFSSEKWFEKYYNTTSGKTPTTGYALYKYFRSRRPKMEIIGLGFNLDDHSTPHSAMHDWQYEYNQYAKDKLFKAIS